MCREVRDYDQVRLETGHNDKKTDSGGTIQKHEFFDHMCTSFESRILKLLRVFDIVLAVIYVATCINNVGSIVYTEKLLSSLHSFTMFTYRSGLLLEGYSMPCTHITPLCVNMLSQNTSHVLSSLSLQLSMHSPMPANGHRNRRVVVT